MKKLLGVALSAGLLGLAGAALPGAAMAQNAIPSVVRSETDAAVNAVQEQARAAAEPGRQGDIAYTSGGVGDEGLAHMRAIESGYNLRLLFAVKGSGEYLANVHVRLVDKSGNTVLDTVSQGPYFFANVRPGRYRVVAESEGRPIRRTVDVGGTGAVSRALYWQHTG